MVVHLILLLQPMQQKAGYEAENKMIQRLSKFWKTKYTLSSSLNKSRVVFYFPPNIKILSSLCL